MTAAEWRDSNPRAQLSRTRDLARRVRREQRANWFPLLVFALVTYLAISVTRAGHAVIVHCRGVALTGQPGARVCAAQNSAAYVYWPIALIAAYMLIAGFYVRMSRARGVGTRVRPYVITGLALAVAIIAASIWAAHRVLVGGYDLLGWHVQGPELRRLITPAWAIGLALLVLAVVDRSLAPFGVTFVYLVIAIGRIDLGWTIDPASWWAFAPRLVIQGSVLLFASAGFALAQRPHQHVDASPA
jgi:hypothetical protein